MGVDKLRQRGFLDEEEGDSDELIAQRQREGYQQLTYDEDGINRPSGKGIHALDEEPKSVLKKNRQAFNGLDDATDTDNSIDKPQSQQRYTSDQHAKRGIVF